MANLMISEDQAARLLALRETKPYDRKAKKKAIFAEIRGKLGIPARTKIKMFIESEDHPLYRVVRNRHTNAVLTDGQDTPVPAITKAASPTKAEGFKAPVPAKKTVKAPAKAAKPAAKPAALEMFKALAPGHSATKSAKHQVEVRGTVDGQRVRLGWATTEAAKVKIIAAAKAKK